MPPALPVLAEIPASVPAGVAVGFLAAFLQSCSYLVSARYVRQSGRPAWTLLPPAYILMAPASLALAAALLRFAQGPVPWRAALLPAAFSMATCVLANATMFQMLKSVDASLASPMLGLKVPMLALFYTFALARPCTGAQWAAVGLVFVATAALAVAGRRLSRAAWGWLLATCAGFSLSDWLIGETFAAVGPAFPSFAPRALFSLAFIYLVCAGAAALALPFCPPLPRAGWMRWAAPYAAVWFVAMMALYACFATCGIVLGNIVQNTRGLISIALGWLVARAGRVDLEERVSRAVLVRRVAAAVLLLAAIALYALGA
jgi:hypothetical protein